MKFQFSKIYLTEKCCSLFFSFSIVLCFITSRSDQLLCTTTNVGVHVILGQIKRPVIAGRAFRNVLFEGGEGKRAENVQASFPFFEDYYCSHDRKLQLRSYMPAEILLPTPSAKWYNIGFGMKKIDKYCLLFKSSLSNNNSRLFNFNEFILLVK